MCTSEANRIARNVLTKAREQALDGRFDDFLQGMALGQLAVLDTIMRADEWVIQGIRNELWFLSRQHDKNKLARHAA